MKRKSMPCLTLWIVLATTACLEERKVIDVAGEPPMGEATMPTGLAQAAGRGAPASSEMASKASSNTPSTSTPRTGLGPDPGTPEAAAIKCDSVPPAKVVWDQPVVKNFEMWGDELFFADRALGRLAMYQENVKNEGGIRSLSFDGAQTSVLFEANGQIVNDEIWVDDDIVYFLMSDDNRSAGEAGAYLYTLPITGGTPERLPGLTKTFAIENTNLFGSDADYLYVMGLGPQKTIAKISKATGDVTNITATTNSGLEIYMMTPQIYQDEIWWRGDGTSLELTNLILSSPNSIPKDAVEAQPAKLNEECGAPLSANTGGVFCNLKEKSGSGVDLGKTLRFENPNGFYMSPAFGSKVFVAYEGAGHYSPIIDLDPKTFAYTVPACGNVWRVAMRATDTEVFWIEKAKDADKGGRIKRAQRLR